MRPLRPWRAWMDDPEAAEPIVTLPMAFGDLVVRSLTWGGWTPLDGIRVRVADRHGPRVVDLQLVAGRWMVVGCWNEERTRRLALRLSRVEERLLALLAHAGQREWEHAKERHALVREAREDLWLHGAVRA